jgi:cytochrome c556
MMAWALGVSVIVSSAIAQEDAAPTAQQQAESAVKVRQGLLELINWSFRGHLGGMMRHKEPFNAAAFQQAGERIKALAALIPEVFRADTRKFSVTTKADESIWTRQPDFASKADDLAKAAAALEQAARGGDKDTTLKAAGVLGKTCGGCHDSYKDK